MHPDALLVPLGVLELSRGPVPIQQLNILFGQSRQTSDFIVDALELWWTQRGAAHRQLYGATDRERTGVEPEFLSTTRSAG